MPPGSLPALVGRAGECAAIDDALRVVAVRPGTIVSVEGEPGIGKSRLLEHLAARAAEEKVTVLGARASEFESDLAYALWTEALDRHLAEAGERRVSRLGLADPGALAAVLPALAAAQPPADRHRMHRALRDLLERLAASRPLVLWFDDLQWADAASVDALGALVRRPPAGSVLFAVAARAGQLPARLTPALAGAQREERLVALNPAPLTELQAVELVGAVAAAIFPQTGGNPFYLEQLARVRGTPRRGSGPQDDTVPSPVAAALATELAALGPQARQVLDAAAVAGDPFDPELAAAIAELPEPAALHALDELLLCGLVRSAAVPRRFAFRHPLVRHAVYVAARPAWRLAAHARAAAALERRGAGAVQRAHHVEHAAQPGDEHAIALLSAAAGELQAPAPRIAARFHAAALRLLPDQPDRPERRSRMQRLLADAQAAAGDPEAARVTLLDALQTAPLGERLALTVALANQEWWLDGHQDARRRLQVALTELPAQPSPDRVRLRLALALTALLACDLDEAQAHADDARVDAAAIGDPTFELAALVPGALASASAADGPDALRRLDASTTAVLRLTAQQLSTRLPAFWMQGRARRALGQLDASLADLRRGAELAAQTGRERILLILTIESVATLVELGRIADATAAADEGLERARLFGNPRMLLWAHCALSSARLAAGDVSAALEHAEQAAQQPTRADFHAAGQPDWCRGAALTAAGNPDRAAAALLAAFAGDDRPPLLPVDRPAAAADLIEAQLALGDITAAEGTLARAKAAAARAGTAPARALIGIADAMILLARRQPHEATAAAAGARETASGMPLTHARALLAEGRACAAASDRDGAIRALSDAESALHGYGALRRRDEAARALRQLGHPVVRASRAGGGGSLTAREREIAELVATGRTNREAATQLVLSTRTIEAHLRTIYAKLDVRSRVELARALRQD